MAARCTSLLVLCAFKLSIVHSAPQRDHASLMSDINALVLLSDEVEDAPSLLHAIRTEIESIHPTGEIEKDAEYGFDESIDCVFDIFDGTDQIQDLMPVVARRLSLSFNEDTQRKLYKAVESAIYLLCAPPEGADSADKDEFSITQSHEHFETWKLKGRIFGVVGHGKGQKGQN